MLFNAIIMGRLKAGIKRRVVQRPIDTASMTIVEDALRTNQSKLCGRLVKEASSADALPLSRH